MEALLPEVTDWETAISDQATKEAIPEYAKRRRGEPSAFTKHSATCFTRYSTTWQEEAEPVLVSELKHKYSALLSFGAVHAWTCTQTQRAARAKSSSATQVLAHKFS